MQPREVDGPVPESRLGGPERVTDAERLAGHRVGQLPDDAIAATGPPLEVRSDDPIPSSAEVLATGHNKTGRQLVADGLPPAAEEDGGTSGLRQ